MKAGPPAMALICSRINMIVTFMDSLFMEC